MRSVSFSGHFRSEAVKDFARPEYLYSPDFRADLRTIAQIHGVAVDMQWQTKGDSMERFTPQPAATYPGHTSLAKLATVDDPHHLRINDTRKAAVHVFTTDFASGGGDTRNTKTLAADAAIRELLTAKGFVVHTAIPASTGAGGARKRATPVPQFDYFERRHNES